jgi:hypothetical protein
MMKTKTTLILDDFWYTFGLNPTVFTTKKSQHFPWIQPQVWCSGFCDTTASLLEAGDHGDIPWLFSFVNQVWKAWVFTNHKNQVLIRC